MHSLLIVSYKNIVGFENLEKSIYKFLCPLREFSEYIKPYIKGKLMNEKSNCLSVVN